MRRRARRPSGAPAISDSGRLSDTGRARERIEHLAAGQAKRAAADLDHRLDRLAFDDPVLEQPALDGRAARARPDPQRGQRPQQRERDARHEQRRGVERERREREQEPAERNPAERVIAGMPSAVQRLSTSLTAR